MSPILPQHPLFIQPVVSLSPDIHGGQRLLTGQQWRCCDPHPPQHHVAGRVATLAHALDLGQLGRALATAIYLRQSDEIFRSAEYPLPRPPPHSFPRSPRLTSRTRT